MSNFDQIPSFPVTGGDFTVYNAALTDIPAGSAVVVDTANPPSGATPIGALLQTASGSVAEPLGILVEVLKAGGVARCRRLGTYPAIASGTVTGGDFLQIDGTTGKEGRV